MVKQLQKWQCTVCGKKYATKKDATACEEVVPAVYPVGCMFSHFTAWIEDTFAVAGNRIKDHENNGWYWWSRDEDANKKLIGNEHTGQSGSGQLRLHPSDRHVDLETPSCIRMIEWLESQGITPTVWDGEKAISLKEARANPKARWRYKTGFGAHSQWS